MKSEKRTRTGQSLNWTFAVLVCILAFSTSFLISCGKEEEEVTEEIVRPVKTVTVEAIGGFSGLTLPGRVRAGKRVEFAFKEVGGRLIELPIAGREGQQVEKGELLARIDPQDFQTNVRNVEGRLREAEAALQLAQSEYERVLRIQKKDPGAVSAADIDRRRETVNQTQGRIKSLKAEVDNAKNQLSYTYLRAPFSGVIARRFVDNFQEVKPKQPIVSLEDISHVEVLVDVPENIMALRRAGEEEAVSAIAVFPTAPGEQYPLQLKEYATTADPQTQTYQVVLQMPQPEGINILPGMTASVVISTSGEVREDRAILIPAIAVLADPSGKNYVWVVDPQDMTVHKRDVSVGQLTGSENINILEGLEGGEKIVVAGVLKLQDGMEVRLWDRQQEGTDL
jgi:multidrug efflux system membrane fusion protein